MQWITGWYPMGKTSIESRWNLPGKIGWVLMEAPGFTNLLYIMFTLPSQNGIKSLPAENWLMAGLFVSNDDPALQPWLSCRFCSLGMSKALGLVGAVGVVLANPARSLVDNSLHLPRHSVTFAAEPLHVSHPYLSRPCGSLFSVVQLNLPRRLACLLRPADGRRLGRPQAVDRGGDDGICLGLPREHLPRRRAAGDQTGGRKESTAETGRPTGSEEDNLSGQGLHDAGKRPVQTGSVSALSLRVD